VTGQLDSWGGQELREALIAGLARLEHHAEMINALNVYPVPDGDTGTNMSLTMQAALEEAADAPVDASAEAVAQAVAQGALMGARGNSGVILSQIFRGIARRLRNLTRFDAVVLAEAMEEASDTAYQGVIKPVEGTILTVIREAANAGKGAVAKRNDLLYLMEEMVAEAGRSVARTPELLPVLAEAGVVDAGGQGLFVILEGMLRYMRGEMMELAVSPGSPVDLQAPTASGGWGYDVQFILRGKALAVEAIREAIAGMGDSALVVGDSAMVKVHVHSLEPGTPLNYGARLGSLSHVIIENMQDQYEEFIAGQVPEQAGVDAASYAVPSAIGIVAVTTGEGITRVLKSLGTGTVVHGGQTMNPSTEELLEAVEGLKAKEVIILPNNSNIVLTAQQAQELSSKRVRVVPTQTLPQGVSALLAFNYQADLETNVRAMDQARQEVRTAELTFAVRPARVNGLEVHEGQVIGLLDGELTAYGSNLDGVALEMLRQMSAQDGGIITIYAGEGTSLGQVEALASLIREQYPDQEIEVVESGHSHYPYILSVE
jgi:DAK2 domain fusion protein YloV